MIDRPSPRNSAPGSRGFALIIVLWMLVLLAAIGTYILANARTETALARNVLASARAEALADAAIVQAAANLSQPAAFRWKLDGAEHRLALLGGEVSIRLYDESAKINPNLASEALLSALFATVGVERAQARRLGAAIADWVDADDKERPAGAEQKQYQDAGRFYGPPNAPIESLDELQLVLGMTPEILSAVRPYLTIFTDAAAPDPKVASLIVRRVLSLAEQIERELSPNESAAREGAESGGAEGAQPATSPSADAQTIAAIEVVARNGTHGTFVRRAVLRIDSDVPKGYLVLDWRLGDQDE